MFGRHVQTAIDFYDANYDMVLFVQEAGSPRFTLTASENKCRFCAKSPPEVTFKKDAHALPDSIGNRTLFVAYECDACNLFFGSGVENHFGKWSLPYRVVSRIRGKNGFATLKKEHAGWRVEARSDGLEMHMRRDNLVLNVDEGKKRAEIKVPRDKHIPVAVFKAFVKMALSIMPDNELRNFGGALTWIKDTDHTQIVEGQCAQVIASFLPGSAPADNLGAVLCRRRVDDLSLPYMVFVLKFSNYIFQIVVPVPLTLQAERYDVNYHPFLFGIEAKPSSPTVLDLTSPIAVQGDIESFMVRYLEVPERANSPDSDNAIRKVNAEGIRQDLDPRG